MITDYQWIDDNSELEQLILSINDSDEVAFDSEFERVNTFYPKPALFQLQLNAQYYLIDMKKVSHHQVFLKLLNRIILHSGSEDLEILFNLNQQLPDSIFDTQVAASLCGYGLHFSYQNIVKELLGVELSKAHSRSDWMQRPLSSAQIQYALEDVVYLHDLKKILYDQLNQLQRLEWYDQLIKQRKAAIVKSQHVEKTFTKIAKSQKFNKSQQKILWCVLDWRENFAMKRNKPRQWIIKNDQIVEIVRRKPQHPKQLLSIGLYQKFVKYNADDIFALYEKASQLTDEALPVIDKLSVKQADRFSQAKQALNSKTQQLNIPSALIINNSDLKALIAAEKTLQDVEMWQLIHQ